MKRKAIISWLLVSTILFVSALQFLSYVSFQNNTLNSKQIIFSLINNGDLVLRRGKSTQSYMVSKADSDAKFSHIGIISIENNKSFVIHAVPHKYNVIKKEKLSEFLNPKNKDQGIF